MAPPPDNKVSLGCGTLILIALIVMIFSRSGDDRSLRREIEQLQHEVRNLSSRSSVPPSSNVGLQQSVEALKRSIDAQSGRIDSLKSEVHQMRNKLDAAPAPLTPPVEGE